MANKEFKLPENPHISDGMKVPEGYFQDAVRRFQEALPANPNAEHPERKPEAPRTWWQNYRPYIYMAAMFAGFWCMTKMFSLMKTNSDPYSLDDNTMMTAALRDNEFVDDYVLASMNEYDILEDLYEQGYSFDDLNNY